MTSWVFGDLYVLRGCAFGEGSQGSTNAYMISINEWKKRNNNVVFLQQHEHGLLSNGWLYIRGRSVIWTFNHLNNSNDIISWDSQLPMHVGGIQISKESFVCEHIHSPIEGPPRPI